MLRGPKWGGLYGIPGGKVEYGESLETALRREVHEETGLSLGALRFLTVQEMIEDPEFYRTDHFVSVNYTGATTQTQFILNEEWTDGCWCTCDQALNLPLNRPTRELLEVPLPLPVSTPDRVSIEGLRVDCIVGIRPHERVRPQPLEISAALNVHLARAGQSGDLADTVDYSDLARTLRRIAVEGRFGLLETMGERMCTVLLATPGVERVRLTLRKPCAIPHAAAAVVELERP